MSISVLSGVRKIKVFHHICAIQTCPFICSITHNGHIQPEIFKGQLTQCKQYKKLSDGHIYIASLLFIYAIITHRYCEVR